MLAVDVDEDIDTGLSPRPFAFAFPSPFPFRLGTRPGIAIAAVRSDTASARRLGNLNIVRFRRAPLVAFYTAALQKCSALLFYRSCIVLLRFAHHLKFHARMHASTSFELDG